MNALTKFFSCNGQTKKFNFISLQKSEDMQIIQKGSDKAAEVMTFFYEKMLGWQNVIRIQSK